MIQDAAGIISNIGLVELFFDTRFCWNKGCIDAQEGTCVKEYIKTVDDLANQLASINSCSVDEVKLTLVFRQPSSRVDPSNSKIHTEDQSFRHPSTLTWECMGRRADNFAFFTRKRVRAYQPLVCFLCFAKLWSKGWITCDSYGFLEFVS